MDVIYMKYPPLTDQIGDELSLHRWFSEVIRVRNAFPAIARGRTETAEFLCDDGTAAFFRKSDTYDDLLIVMNLSDWETEKDLSSAGGGLELAAVLNTGEESIYYQGSTIRLPAYSIAVFTCE